MKDDKLTIADKVIKSENANELAKELSVDELNDYEKEETTFIFDDGSLIVQDNSEMAAYFDFSKISIDSDEPRSKEQSYYEFEMLFGEVE